MRRYLEHIRAKEPHHRREHALQVAGVITAAVFVVWVATLGVRLAEPAPEGDEDALTASAFSAYQPGLLAPKENILEVVAPSGGQ